MFKKSFNQKPKKRVCHFCAEKISYIDYKDTYLLRKYISERGKIQPALMTGVCSKHQRELTKAIKRARLASLLPFVTD